MPSGCWGILHKCSLPRCSRGPQRQGVQDQDCTLSTELLTCRNQILSGLNIAHTHTCVEQDKNLLCFLYNSPEALAHLQVFPSVICAPERVGVSGTDHVTLLDPSCAVDVDRVIRVKCVSCVWPANVIFFANVIGKSDLVADGYDDLYGFMEFTPAVV